MLVDNSGGAAAVNLGNDSFAGSDSAGGNEVDRNSAGNRWPREETLVLLQVRQSMDEAFRDSNLKAPLWDEVSRSPATSRIRSKMLYATSKERFRREMDGVHYEIQATDPTEMDLEVLKDRAN